MPGHILRAGLCAIALLCAAPPAHADAFDEAMRVYRDKDYGEARARFRQLAAKDNPRAAFMLGVMHERGLGVNQDVAKAAQWYQKAAEAGDRSAQYNLGILYQFGRGVPQDHAAAVKWLTMAANQGHGQAQNNLGTLYYSGTGIENDLVEAWKWFTLSLDNLDAQERKYALRNRHALKEEMTQEQLAEAKRRVAAWRPSG